MLQVSCCGIVCYCHAHPRCIHVASTLRPGGISTSSCAQVQPARQHAMPQVHRDGAASRNVPVLQSAMLHGAHMRVHTCRPRPRRRDGSSTKRSTNRPPTRGSMSPIAARYDSASCARSTLNQHHHTSQGRSDAMPTFSWTGSLRPDLVGPRRSVPASIPKPDWAVGGIPREEMDSPQQALGGCCDRLSLPLSSVHLPTIIPTIIHYDSASALCQGHCRHPARLHAGTSRARCSTRGHCAWSHHRRGGRGGAQGNHCWGSLPIPSQLLPLSKELLHLCQRGASCAVGYRCTRCLCMCMRMEST